MRNTIRRFAAQFGADSESGVIAALIAVTIIAAVTLVGTNLGLIYIGVAGKLVMPV